LWHAIFLSLTATFTEVNTIIPALILSVGGSAVHVGIVSAIVIGLPVVTKLFFSSFLSSKKTKKPYLLLGIDLRVLALISIAVTLVWYKSFSFIVLILLLYAELFVFSVGGAFASLPYVYLIGGFKKETRIKFFTKKPMISSIGMLLSVLIARYILAKWEYPTQYVILFSLSAIALFIASFGFRIVEEKPSAVTKKVPILEILKDIPTLFKKDPNFFKFLIYSNIMGAALALIPFYIGYAKDVFTINSTVLGYVLVVQIVGMFVASFIFPKIIKNHGFKGILRFRIVIHFILPFIAIFVASSGSLYGYLSVFFLAGFALSARVASEDAALIELSTDENRVIYTALAGTLNIAIIVFPLILGILISIVGYPIVFVTSSIITLIAFPVLKSLCCPVDVEKESLSDITL
jgi:MFS family permease